MARGNPTRDVERSFGLKPLAFAKACLTQARRSATEADDEYTRAASASLVIEAVIAAGDAACALTLGRVWKGAHTQAHTLLSQIAGSGRAENAHRRVVSAKSRVQYLGEPVTAARLDVYIRQAEIVLEFAEALQRRD